MKNGQPKITKLDSITEIHRTLDIPGPTHPLITLLDTREESINLSKLPVSYVTTLYKISFISKLGGKFRYGQGYYDFDEGSMVFTAPNQIVGSTAIYKGNEGYSLIFHQDFLQGYPLASKIKQYGFFSYTSNEALHLSDKERATVSAIFSIIQDELNSRIDDFSHEVVIAQIELLLSYAKRFYKRQFLTRHAAGGTLLTQLETLLNNYFIEQQPAVKGIITVQYLADKLNYTPNYLSDMLRSLTGLNAQQHIHEKLIERAKELLSTTTLTISEVAYQLGFEHSQSFSRLFKLKTKVSPVQYRASVAAGT
ncbi:helix-turn-helix transcriptional regulator [Mucilaginibacter pallidiroseus]|uniref:Helix-turn-helix transcriptional regulator n=1 Tax=Mucilaginibacter pallidiroseus TaxID=2599295 RepID=A0A563TZB9_9SPHI|nr:helix-turn-helix transcriptional regulator [Mucilaginibacter pallidiroseus]TWR24706.1 helix-turn-helix transcriptional regulator [Mucilaginibacter pallidiroseus]